MYKIDCEYFNVIDNQDKAYALAWFWSRGSGHIQISKKDVDILDTLRVLLGYTGEVRIYGDSAELNITSAPFHESLAAAGCVKNKHCVQFLPIIPEDLMSHFVRGIYDSYGTIRLCKGKYINVTIVYDESFITALRGLLFTRLNIATKHYYRYSHSNTMQMMITKHGDATKFLNWAYTDANCCMTRKFQNYCEYLQKSV